MSLLREIQNTSIDSNAELANLLRKCLVLAARLGNAEFKQWVESELNGYKSKDELPDYRILHVYSKGNFSGPFGSGLRNADIPMLTIPKEIWKNLKHSYLTEPVASMEALVANNESSIAQEPWNPDIVAYVGQNIYQNMHCMQAWKVIPVNSIVATLDSIRNRILSFVLEIEAEAPDAGDAPINSNHVSQERVKQIFNTYIMGDVQNVATGSEIVKQKAILSEGASDDLFTKLLDAVSKSGANSDAVSIITSSIEEMRASQGSPTFRKHYQSFMANLADHIQVFGPAVAPFLPGLTAILR